MEMGMPCADICGVSVGAFGVSDTVGLPTVGDTGVTDGASVAGVFGVSVGGMSARVTSPSPPPGGTTSAGIGLKLTSVGVSGMLIGSLRHPVDGKVGVGVLDLYVRQGTITRGARRRDIR